MSDLGHPRYPSTTVVYEVVGSCVSIDVHANQTHATQMCSVYKGRARLFSTLELRTLLVSFLSRLPLGRDGLYLKPHSAELSKMSGDEASFQPPAKRRTLVPNFVKRTKTALKKLANSPKMKKIVDFFPISPKRTAMSTRPTVPPPAPSSTVKQLFETVEIEEEDELARVSISSRASSTASSRLQGLSGLVDLEVDQLYRILNAGIREKGKFDNPYHFAVNLCST